MVGSHYQKVAFDTMKGWIKGDLLALLPRDFFQDPVVSALALGGNCVRESKWRWVGLFNLSEGKRIFLKRDLTKNWVESLKYMFLPSKGRKEWFIAFQSGKRHLNVPKPMGWLERVHQGLVKESYYLSEAITSKGSLVELIDLLKDDKISIELVKMVIRIHNTGLFHQDLHAGNFLWDGETLFLIDLHRAKFLHSLTMDQRLWNLAQLFHSLRSAWDTKEHEKFLDQYFEEDLIYLKKKKLYLQKIYYWMDQLRKRQWSSRTKRCLKESTEFSVDREKRLVFYHRRDFPLDHLKRTIGKHLTIVQQTPALLVKESPEVKISIFEDDAGRFCVKHFCYPHWWDHFKKQYRQSKGLKAWIGGNGLKVRGMPSVKPLAFVARKGRLGEIENFLIMEASEEEEEMDRYLCRGFEGTLEKKRFIKAFSIWLGQLHQRSIYHQDMKACNILVSKENQDWSFKLLDLEDIRFVKKVNERKLFKTFLQLNTSIPKSISPKDRLRVLRWYLKQNPIIRDKKTFLFRLIKKSRERGIVYVSLSGVVEERFH